MTTSFGAANTAIAKDLNVRVATSFNGLKHTSDSLLLSKRLHVLPSFSSSEEGSTSIIRAVSTVKLLLISFSRVYGNVVLFSLFPVVLYFPFSFFFFSIILYATHYYVILLLN